ncbi:MAG: ZIP family transporter [Solirubrobacterales bacterium]
MELIEVKAAALVVLLGLAYAGGVLPLRVSKSPRADVLFSLSNAFAGGLFLAVGLIHMLGDAGVGLDAAEIGTDYPVELLLATGGFLAVLLLEAVVGGRVRASLGDAYQPGKATSQAGLRARLLAVILSVHSLIAGIAIGAEITVAATVAILIALVSHKGPEGYALGISLYEAGRNRSQLIRTVMAYAAMTPIGIVIGSVLSEALSGQADLIFESVFDALAAGTFTYLATFGVLKEEFSAPEMLGRKYLCAVAGAALIAVITIWA